MYKLLLIFKYLRRKLAPMFAAVAVMLCTMMVIIVLSVMGGFLDLLRTSAKKLTGDVTVSAPSELIGFPYYQELIDRLEDLPEVDAASPVIRTYGLLKLGEQTLPVSIEGIRPRKFSKIVEYRDTLRWTAEDVVKRVDRRFVPEERQGMLGKYYRKERRKAATTNLTKAGLTLKPPPALQRDAANKNLPGMVIGIEVNPNERRDRNGRYHFINSAVGRQAMLTMMPLTQRGRFTEPSYGKLTVVNEFKSGLYDVDANFVFVPFGYLQKKLDMQHAVVRQSGINPTTGAPLVGKQKTRAGRTSEVVVKGAAGYDDLQVRDAVAKAVNRFSHRHADVFPPSVETWREVHAGLLSAVKNETGLVTFLFAVISLVAVVMVATTFYMIVLEKTRDIGVLRAIGASRAGIRHVFLGYGLAVGVVGGAAGFGLAYLIVTHLNQIQDVIAAWTGWRMWDPQTYFFDKIPDHVDPAQASVIVAGAILSSVVGAFIPALIAAWQDPVEALRYE